MATPPTLVNSYTTVFDTTAITKTMSVTTQAGDVVVVIGAADNDDNSFLTPTGNSITYTQKQYVHIGGQSFSDAAIWTGTDATGGTNWTLSLSRDSTNNKWGAACLVFRGSGGVGASNKDNQASGSPSLGLTTTQDNSAIVVIDDDWNAASGTSRTWRTVNSITPTSGNGLEYAYFDGSTGPSHTVYGAYYNDAGAAGSKTVGLSTPSQKYSIAAVEIKGATFGIPVMWVRT
jgi:hypothetical protein